MEKNDRTYNTLFMLMSIDGKISTGVDERDIDSDTEYVSSLKVGRYQYVALEQETDLASFNTGLVMAKVGWNNKKDQISKIPVEFIIVDNKPHLTTLGVENLLKHVKRLYIVTANSNHPAYGIKKENLKIIYFENTIDFKKLFNELKINGIERVTIQSGGTMNSIMVRNDLIDELSLVMAPVMIGGKDTASLEDGESIKKVDELRFIKDFELVEAKVLEHSFLHLRYKRK